ncbi:precorrin-6y C5,15-methyltransferase (decarboxylating) subunit CbiE, partial [Desulfovibrio sp. OttesenSCG-928-O18]|nr:precorrin-6y C5,15-methyltransferase (decarboxylating) subunit CbiE [Desulfovibrio sp. OttesenSCG-928-O18]
MAQQRNIAVIGAGTGDAQTLAAHPALVGVDAVIGGARLLEAVAANPARKIPVGKDVAATLDEAAVLLEQGKTVAVLASGDPLFFGIGTAVAARFGADRLCVYPAVSSLQTAAARLTLPWADVAAVSLHGRQNPLPLAHALIRGGPVCLLTDRVNTPSVAAIFMLERGRTNYRTHVFARLGDKEESAWHGSLAAMAEKEFPDPNVVFLLPDTSLPAPLPLCPGQPESAYAHERALITKWPVRAAALAALRIEPGHTVWDLGSGSGSVAVEASALAWRGQIVAVEKNAARAAHIAENRRRFGAANLEIAHATLPGCLDTLPAPDRVFIGGGLGGDRTAAEQLIRQAWNRLKPGGRLVAACVLLCGPDLARDTLAQLGCEPETAMVQAASSTPLGGDAYL